MYYSMAAQTAIYTNRDVYADDARPGQSGQGTGQTEDIRPEAGGRPQGAEESGPAVFSFRSLFYFLPLLC